MGLCRKECEWIEIFGMGVAVYGREDEKRM